MAEHITDMTQGKPGKLIIQFALPLMLGNVFQQLYTLVDTIVVGQAVGVEALAALGAADWLNWMVLGIVTGLTQGFAILTAQRKGAEDAAGLRKSVAMSAILSGIGAILITAGSLLSAMPILRLLKTSELIIDNSHLYLTICFAGIPVIMAYNLLASVLRSLGNSRTPLLAMVVAAVINIALDLLFVIGFGWGVGGAAAATVIAQFCSGLFCFLVIRRIPLLQMQKEDWKLEFPVLGRLLLLGAPMAFQNAIIAVGGLVVQSVINGFGIAFVAGFTATNKLYGLLELAAISFGFSLSTYAGQNLGAQQYRRIRRGVHAAAKMALLVSLVISIVMIVFGKPILSLFISGAPDQTQEVLRIAYTYLFIMACLLSILYMLFVYRSALQGMGNTMIPMISGIVELVMRVSIILILPRFFGEWGVYFAEVFAWTGAAVLLAVSYYIQVRKLPKEDAKPHN